jgi:hypothetical protein
MLRATWKGGCAQDCPPHNVVSSHQGRLGWRSVPIRDTSVYRDHDILHRSAPMVNNKLRVYVSSTFGDLQEHRQAARDAIVQAGAIPVVMEQFVASPESPLEVCRDEVRNSDVMVLIVGHRYGAVLPGADESITEFEFSAAREAGIPILAFMVADNYPWPQELIDSGDAAGRLKRFKERLRSQLIVASFTSPSDLVFQVLRALYHLLTDRGLKPPDALTSKALKPGGSERDELVIRIEEHLNSLRTDVAEIRDRIELTRSHLTAPAGPSNRPASFLGVSAERLESDLCFVAMPYSTEWSEALEDILDDICRGAGMRILVARNMDGRFIPNDIWKGITAAAVIVADITDGNPNVAYEIGLADVLGKEVVLLCQGNKVPFDFSGQRLICYENTMKGSVVLREELTARLRRVSEKPIHA